MSEPEILYEDDEILAINKPAGLLVHSSRHWSFETPPALTDWLKEKYPAIVGVGDDPERPGIVHRLDRETSGVMIIAKTSAAFAYLKSLFQKRQLQKDYRALVRGRLARAKGRIDVPISIKDGSVKRTVFKGKMPREAVTDYEVVEQFADYALVAAQPHTGRTHQIRVHFASLGHPIAGDTLYGGKKQPEWATRLMLHSNSLELPLSSGRRLRLEAPLPPEFLEALELLRQGE